MATVCAGNGCEATLVPTGKRGAPRKYCESCRPTHRDPVIKVCPTCGCAFQQGVGYPTDYCTDHRTRQIVRPVTQVDLPALPTISAPAMTLVKPKVKAPKRPRVTTRATTRAKKGATAGNRKSSARKRVAAK